MSYEDVLSEAQGLPIAERLRLVEEVSRSVRDELLHSAPRARDGNEHISESRRESERILTMLSSDGPLPSIVELRGILAGDAPPPTDEQLREDYTEYLIRKYS